jgi:2-oxoglutarate dehydrogenase E1 component
MMTPKSLLRHRACTSALDEFSDGRFHGVIAPDEISSDHPHVILCAGKIYYELDERRHKMEAAAPPIVRLEQLYPLPMEELKSALAPIADGTQLVWVQEEPENMGAWRFLHAHWGDTLFGRFPLTCVSRPASASPATGSKKAHEREQEQLIERALRFDGRKPA